MTLSPGLVTARRAQIRDARKRRDLAELRRFVRIHKRVPFQLEFSRAKGLPSYQTAKARWGSVAAFVRAAGFTPRPQGRAVQHHRPGQCPQCGGFAAAEGRPCRRCQAASAPRPPKPTPRPKRKWILPTDFTLHEAEMRALLEAQCGHPMKMRGDYGHPTRRTA